MALKFGPQWLRDLSDGGLNPSQPGTPTMSVKFKLAEYRYGREEMLALFNDNSPPPDQVQKHQSIFSNEIQKPITLMPLTEDEQRLVSQGFNSTVVLRAIGRGSGPPLRTSRGGGTVERSRGRGRGRGEGYIIRPENGDVAYNRPTQDGWEHVGRKFERSYSRGYDESGTAKREFSRSSSDNWRDKRHDDEEEDDGGVAWRNTRDTRDTRETNNPRWGPSSRPNWREPQREGLGFDGDRRPPPPRRGFDQDSQAPHRTSESYDNDGEVPEWVEDEVGDDPGTFDSSGAFVSTKEGRRHSDTKPEAPNIEGTDKKTGNQHPSQLKEHPPSSESLNSYTSNKLSSSQSSEPVYIPPNSRNGTGDSVDSRLPMEQPKLPPANPKGQPDSYSVLPVSSNSASSNKGDGDSGFAFPNKQETNGTCAPPGQYSNTPAPVSSLPHPVTVHKSEPGTRTRLTDPDFLHMEKSLQNLVASMAADHRDGRQLDISQGALPLTHENSNKWFYKDPQGEVQGPFTNEEMSQWFSAGFFTMSLVIKRGCDDSFKQLGELIKRYGRVPFLPGPPLPPLITSIPNEPSIAPTPPLTMPLLMPSTSATPLVGPGLPSVPDPLILQHMLLQQEYLKQTFLMRQMQLQTLHQMQEQDSFKSLSPEQQQHLSMQMMMQTNPVFMQHLQQLQQQQLLLQQQQLQEQQKVSQATAESNTVSFSQSQPSSSNTTTATTTTNNNSGAPDKASDDGSAWGTIQQYIMPGVWSQTAPQPMLQPASLWDIDTSNGTLSPAYLAHMEKIKRERKDEKLKEDERLFQDELEKKQEEIRRQQEDLERQRSQMKRDMEELERQRQIELQKIEESQRQEDERNRLEFERKQQEKAEEKKRVEEEKKRQEEERKRDHELKKQEDKKRKEEEKRRQQEEQKRMLAEMRRKKEEELLHQQEIQQQQDLEAMRQQELLNQQQEALRQQKEEEERMLREASERERLDVHKRQQYELQRQQESLRRLQQSQKDQLANIQLPAASNWAAQQQNMQGSPTQSRSLTEIQEEEEARQEQERELEQQHQQTQRMQEQVYLKNIQQQQKSWATQASQGVPSKGVSLLDIQYQEQESAKRTQKDKPNNQTYQAKLSLASPSTWTGPTSGGTWSNQLPWNSGFPNTAAVWDQVSNLSNRKSAVKESGEFPALKNQCQQAKKNSDKSSKIKVAGAKQKKEEESIQKLFQTRQQDDFSHWVMEHVSRFCAPIDVPTFVSFIVEVDSPDDVREYMKTYLGDTKESRDFARQFVEKRSHFRNQARLEKQLEEDSIWGPAPAVNPHNQMRGGGGVIGGGVGNNSSLANDSGEGGSGKSKNRKKKQKMQKLDGSILGFTVHADPNRKNAAGEVESIQ